MLLQWMAKGPTRFPACPSCGIGMGLARAVPKSGDLPALLTYDCKQCGVWLTEAEESVGLAKVRVLRSAHS